MAKKRTTRNSNSKSTGRKSPRRQVKANGNSSSIAIKITSVLVSSLLLATSIQLLRHEIVNLVFKSYSLPIPPGDYASQTVDKAVNLHHLLSENPNNEAKLLRLLSDEVIWFRKSKVAIPKEKIRKSSVYDKFYFGTRPDFSLEQEMDNNYQMTFVGFHRFRKPDSLFCKIEKYYCEIVHGKISQIYPVPIGAVDESKLNKINLLYRNFFPLVFLILLIIVSLIQAFVSLPEIILKALLDIARRFLPV